VTIGRFRVSKKGYCRIWENYEEYRGHQISRFTFSARQAKSLEKLEVNKFRKVWKPQFMVLYITKNCVIKPLIVEINSSIPLTAV